MGAQRWRRPAVAAAAARPGQAPAASDQCAPEPGLGPLRRCRLQGPARRRVGAAHHLVGLKPNICI